MTAHRLTFREINEAVAAVNKAMEPKGARLAVEWDGNGLSLVKYTGRQVVAKGLSKRDTMNAVKVFRAMAETG